MHKNILFAFCAFCILSLPATGYTANRALLIGVGDYQNIGGLQGVNNDLRNMENLLLELGWNPADIIIKHSSKDEDWNSQPTADNIRRWVRVHLIKETTPKDTAVLYFSGHGTSVEDANGDEGGNPDMALVPFDIKLVNGKPDLRTVILDDEVGEWTQHIRAGKTYMIFDACNSGTITRGGGDSVQGKLFTYPGMPHSQRTRGYFPSALKGKYVGISAAKDDQTAWQTRDGGLMTQSFCSAARKAIRDGNWADLNMNFLNKKSAEGIKVRAAQIHRDPHEPILARGNMELAEESLCLNGQCRPGNEPIPGQTSGEVFGKSLQSYNGKELLDLIRRIEERAYSELDADINKTVFSPGEDYVITCRINQKGYLNFIYVSPQEREVVTTTPSKNHPAYPVWAGFSFKEPGLLLNHGKTTSPGEDFVLIAVTEKPLMGRDDTETLRLLANNSRKILSAKVIRIQVR